VSALTPGTRLGTYEVIAPLGAGGMGEVYRARDTRLDRAIALKILSSEFTADEERVRRFKQEAIAASALNHPNILTIHEAGEADGHQFIATEFVDGETLRQVLNRRSRLPVSDSLAIATQVAAALTAAHQAGIIHRDIKPENVMVRRDGYVKVLDFGIAKLAPQDRGAFATNIPTRPDVHTRAGAIVGTLPYMSPEQARGAPVDARTDIWSLGCLLYEMLAGDPPFRGPTSTDVLVAIVDREPAPLAQQASGIPAELEWIVARTLRKNPAERYQTTEQLLGDLRQLQQKVELESHQRRFLPHGGGPPASVGTPPAAIPAILTSRRARRRSRGVSRLARIAMIAAILGTSWYWRRHNAPLAIEAHSLAVLPLKSLDAGAQYLGLGIADAVIRKTSQGGDLIVRPTSAVRRYAAEETDALTAARQLSADVVLEGSVQRAGDRLRVSVNLLRAADGMSLWADNFDMRMTEIFEVEDSVAQQVASHLRLKLDPQLARRPTANPVAYEFYLRGLHHFDQRMSLTDAQRASTIDFFLKAIEADPDFALAHAELANVYASYAVFGLSVDPSLADKARREIERAEALDPELAEIALARSQLLPSRYEGFQSEAAVKVILAAQKRNPTVGYGELGYLYGHLGLPDLAERALARALDIDPTSEYAKRQLLSAYELSAQFDRWRDAHQRFLPNEPIDPWFFISTGQLAQAQRAIDQVPPSDPAAQFMVLPSSAELSALKGDSRVAETAIPKILGRHPAKDPFYHHDAYMIACIYAAGGKSTEAVKWLREAVATGMSAYPLFERSTLLDRVRQAPEFVQFMTELKATTERYRREFESAR